MKKYDKYKDSEIEWIGEIPEHWENLRIKQLAIGKNTLFLDGDWIESKNIVFDDKNIRYITTGNIGEGKYKDKGSGYITKDTFKELNCTEVFPDDLLISRLNPPIGRACIVPNLNKRIVTSVDNVILRPNEKYSKAFLKHFFSNSKYFEFTSLEGRGATMQRISRSILGNIKIVIPPKPEQSAIANFLDRKTAEIDNLISKKEKLLKLYDEEKTAIINQAVTKGINPNVKMKDSGVEWLGEIPEHWEVKKLKYVTTNVITGKTPPSSNPEFYNGNINWFSPGDFKKEFILSESKRKITKLAIEKAGIKLYPPYSVLLIGIGATLGKIGIIINSASSNQQINAIIFDKNNMIPFFGLYFLHSFKNAIVGLSNSATLAILNQTQTKELYIFVPPIEEQTVIIQHIETETSRINSKRTKTEKLIELLKEYKTALISEVVTGKIDVREEIPNG